MEQTITKLLQDFEHGRMTRRQLIQSLALTAAAAAAGTPPALAAGGFKAVAVNHISYGVADYRRTRDFYVDLLGVSVTKDDGKQCNLAFGDSYIIARQTRQADNKPYVDHFAITIENFKKDEVEAELRRRGLTPRPDNESFIVTDPDGFNLQISSKAMKP